MANDELRLLEKAVEKITAIAREFGLDFYDIFFEICPADILYTFGAYGMPTRYSHWTFGKAYHKMKTQYDYNLSRIYELVINSDPCYAFLLEGNSLIQNKLVIAHVLAHCDFFKNNVHFRRTARNMVESMAGAAERFRGYEMQYGKDKVESFLDAVISIEEHVDPRCFLNPKKNRKKEPEDTTYDDLWEIDQPNRENKSEDNVKFPESPQKDLLLFLMEHSRDLKDWQRDIISVIRQEMLYFWPQMETKVMNEGWATYWHLKIMRELDLVEDEALEFAKMHTGVVQASRFHLNPYLIGLKLYESIEKRWDQPGKEEKEKYKRAEGGGRNKIFEVRESENDISFLRNYLSKDLIEELDLYLYKKQGTEWKVVEKDWEVVRDVIVDSLTNCGFPYLVVEDGDYGKQGDLYLKHNYEGIELDVFYLEKTLPYVHQIWGRKIHIETVVDSKKVVFLYNGDKISKKFL
ncbi:MAG TPA: stage V sporulation protein R [Desulfotomaculum sp.]|nr:MAG: hypothetical protein XD84_2145 [Desulfotomaculum sp. 46_80]HAG12166.1 stage V sporulation protein R [Desulfotomaculum sp.]HBY04571.1 stage V sporulation protein R [Desulfotomaculum sp.]